MKLKKCAFLLFFCFLGIFCILKILENTKGLQMFESSNKQNIRKKEINVAYVLDDGYTLVTAVSMASVVRNKNFDVFLKFHLFVPQEYKEENMKKIEKILIKNSEECNIDFIRVPEGLYDRSIPSSSWPKLTSYKLFISDFIKSEKCIYIDGDTLVLQDLQALYDQDLSEFFAGAVLDANVIKERNLKDAYYVNSGVILWNLKECRSKNLSKDFINCLERGTTKNGEKLFFVDQDVLNDCCRGKIKNLHFKFNIQEYLSLEKSYEKVDEFTQKCFSKKEWEEVSLNKDFGIIHYCGLTYNYNINSKPFFQGRMPLIFVFSKLWWENAKESEVFEDIKNNYKEGYENAKLSYNI